MRQVFLLVAHVLADDDEFVVIREHRLRQIRFVKLHLYSVNFLLEIASFCRTWHEQGELGLLDHLDCFVEILGRPGLLVEENQGAAILHVNTSDRVQAVHVPHRDEILNLVLVHLRVKYLQRIGTCKLAQTLVFGNPGQLGINNIGFVHDYHELRVRAEQRPLHESWSEGEPGPFLEQLKEGLKLGKKRFQFFQWKSQGHDLILAELLKEAIQIVQACGHLRVSVYRTLRRYLVQRHVVKLVIELFGSCG